MVSPYCRISYKEFNISKLVNQKNVNVYTTDIPYVKLLISDSKEKHFLHQESNKSYSITTDRRQAYKWSTVSKANNVPVTLGFNAGSTYKAFLWQNDASAPIATSVIYR